MNSRTLLFAIASLACNGANADYTVTFARLNNLNAGYAEGPVAFSSIFNLLPGMTGFGNPAPSLGQPDCCNSGMVVFSRNIDPSSSTLYLKSFEAGPVSFLQSGASISVRGADWILESAPQSFDRYDLSILFTPEGRPLSTLNSNELTWYLSSRAYLDNIEFSTTPVFTTPTNIQLPTIDVNGVFRFSVAQVGPSILTFIDPEVAIGYDYVTGTGDPNFATVLLPNVGDGLFTVQYHDGTSIRSDIVSRGIKYSFGELGVSSFRVTGIEVSAGLDPTDGAAFVTGLTFADVGSFTGTMTPITSAVSEPTTASLLFGGLMIGALAIQRGNTRRRSEADHTTKTAA